MMWSKRWERSAKRVLMAVGLVCLSGSLIMLPVGWAQDDGTPEVTVTAEPDELTPEPTSEVTREPTATAASSGVATRDVIRGYRAEVLFPAAIRLYLTVSVPLDAIEELRITLEQSGGLDTTIALDPQQAALGASAADTTIFVYEWVTREARASEDDVLLQPFGMLSYRWEVETTDGGSASVEHAVMIEDSDAGPWEHAGEPPLTLHWNTPRLAGKLLREDAMRTYRLLRGHTGVTEPFEAALYDVSSELCSTDDVMRSAVDDAEYVCSEALVAALYAGADIALIQRPNNGYMPALDRIISHMTRQMYAAYWGDITVPAWFAHGLGAMYRQYPGLASLQYTRLLSQADVLYDLDTLIEGPPESASYLERALWMSQSYLMVMYLVDTYGIDGLFDLTAAIADERDFATAFEALTGGDQAAWVAAWADWLPSEAADDAVLWTPYQDE